MEGSHAARIGPVRVVRCPRVFTYYTREEKECMEYALYSQKGMPNTIGQVLLVYYCFHNVYFLWNSLGDLP